MAIQWEVFRGGQTKPSSQRLSVSINRKGVLTVSKYAFELLGNPEKVLLMFNKRDSVIGLSPTHAGDEDGFDVKHGSGSHNYLVHIAPFCRHNNISVEVTERFAKPGLTSEGFLTLDLKETINVSIRKKRKEARSRVAMADY